GVEAPRARAEGSRAQRRADRRSRRWARVQLPAAGRSPARVGCDPGLATEIPVAAVTGCGEPTTLGDQSDGTGELSLPFHFCSSSECFSASGCSLHWNSQNYGCELEPRSYSPTGFCFSGRPLVHDVAARSSFG